MSTSYAFAWSQGIKESLTLFVPEIFGGASPTYFGPKSVTSGPHYLGAITLPFLLMALFKQKGKTMFVFFGAGTLALIFSWGENFALINELAFNIIPFFDKFRAPETWLVLTAFCYSVVAIYGLSWFFEFLKNKSVSLKELYVPLGVTLFIFAFVLIQVKTMDFTKPGEVENIANQIAQQNNVNPNNPQVRQRAISYVDQNFVPDRKDGANKDLFRFGLFLVFSCAIIWLTLKQKISIAIASIGLIIVTGFDMISVGKRYVPEQVIVSANVSPERYLESQKRDTDQYIMDNIYSDNGEYEYRVFPLMDGAFSNAVPSYFYPTIGGYTGAKLSIVADLQANGGPLFKGNAGLNLDLLGALNIKYITYQQGLNIPGLTPVFNSTGGTVYKNEKLLPKAFFVDSLVTAATPNEAYDFVEQPNVDYSSIAVVETTETLSTSPDSTSKVEVTEYTGAEMTLALKRGKPGFLVLSEIYYPAGWVATLNGNEIPIYKTNFVLRGFEIPEGEHTLKLEFKPKSYSIGVTLSWVSLGFQILIALLFGLNYFKRKKLGES